MQLKGKAEARTGILVAIESLLLAEWREITPFLADIP
jgi:hypothetical protein